MSANGTKASADEVNPVAAMVGQLRPRHKRKSYLVDRRLQYRIVKQVAVLGLLMATLVLCNLYVLWNLTDLYGHDLAVSDYPIASNGAIMLYGLLALVCNTGISLIMILFFSHQFAGPSVKIAQSLKQITRGDLNVRVQLRKSDHFQEIAEEVNQLADEWNLSISKIKQAVNTLQNRSTGSREVEIDKQLAVLEGILERYKLKQ